MEKDGHSRCFITEAKPTKETRHHTLRLVRQFEIQPSSHVKEETLARKSGHRTKALEIRVREQDLHNGLCSGGVVSPAQRVLPRLQPSIYNLTRENNGNRLPALGIKEQNTLSDGRRRRPETLHGCVGADADLQKVTGAEWQKAIPLSTRMAEWHG